MSAVDCVQPAIQHTREQLFRPFRWGQWSRLALVGILAGELHAGGCNFGNLGQLASRPSKGSQELLSPPFPFPHIDPSRIAQYAGIIAAVVLLAMVVFFVFLYISSVYRFILFESVLRRECRIGEGWQRWHRIGRSFFLWQLVFLISTWIVLGVVIGVPVALAIGAGWAKDTAGHIAGVVAGVVLLIGVVLIVALGVAAVQILARDFLVPIMALEDVDFADGWSRLISLIRIEPGRYAVYVLLKFVLTLAAAILFGIMALIPALVIILPSVVIVLAAKAAGMGWSAASVSLLVIFGTMAFVLLIYLVALVSVPSTVFFPAYAMYFFAARYPNLGALLNPAPALPAPESPPVPEPPPELPPPLLPSPEPIG